MMSKSTTASQYQKKTGAALLDFKRLSDLIPAMVAVYNVNNGQYVYVNGAVSKLLGYAPRDFVDNGLDFVASLIHPEDLDQIMSKNQIALAKANAASSSREHDPIISFEYRIRHKKGHWIWLKTDGSVYDRRANGMIEHVLNVSIDITERKSAEDETRRLSNHLEDLVAERSLQLELAMQASRMGQWEWDLTSNKLVWSRKVRQLFGLRATDKITYQKCLRIVHPDDRQKVAESIVRAIKNGKSYQLEHRVVWPNGSIHWLQEQGQAFTKNGQPLRMLGTTMNIDARKSAEAALADSQLKYKTLFGSNTIGITITDLKGRIHQANPKFLKMLGYSRSDVAQGRLRWDMLTPSEYKPLQIKKVNDLKTKGEATPWEKEYFHKNGSRLPVLVGVARLKHTSDLCISFVIDITERKQLAGLNQAKDEFIAVASHQLRTPATSVKQFLGMLLSDYGGQLNAEQLTYAQNAYDSNEHQLKIINDLLLVARLDAGDIRLNRQRHDLNQWLSGLVTTAKPIFTNQKQSLSAVLPKKRIWAKIDDERLQTAIQSLLGNAAKYSSIGAKTTLSLWRRQGMAIIAIRDQGIGITSNDLKRLYKKFSRLDNPGGGVAGGTGLGLYWAKRIIELHGGSIDVKSEPGSGTEFIIHLPL